MKKYEGVLKRVREIEVRNGIYYPKTDESLYITLKVIYAVFGVWAVLMNVFSVISFVLNYDSFTLKNGIANLTITVCVFTVLLILGFVLNCFKVYFIGALVGIISKISLIVIFANQLEDSVGVFGYKGVFYWRHLIPLLVMIILMVCFTQIAVRERIKTNKQYKKVVENLFKMYKTEIVDENSISEEQWNKFLKEYDPKGYKKKFKGNKDER